MNREDAKAVIKSLWNDAFICGDDFIETENGYIITKKETKQKHNRSASNEKRGNEA